MKEPISSLQNPRIKQLVKLREKSSERQKSGLFVIEGRREISMAREGGISLQTLFYCPDLPGNVRPPDYMVALLQDVTLHVFEKIAYRAGSDGLLSLAAYRPGNLAQLRLSYVPLPFMLEAAEKPGTSHAIMRTA